jgi:hypothetical protein
LSAPIPGRGGFAGVSVCVAGRERVLEACVADRERVLEAAA